MDSIESQLDALASCSGDQLLPYSLATSSLLCQHHCDRLELLSKLGEHPVTVGLNHLKASCGWAHRHRTVFIFMLGSREMELHIFFGFASTSTTPKRKRITTADAMWQHTRKPQGSESECAGPKQDLVFYCK